MFYQRDPRTIEDMELMRLVTEVLRRSASVDEYIELLDSKDITVSPEDKEKLRSGGYEKAKSRGYPISFFPSLKRGNKEITYIRKTSMKRSTTMIDDKEAVLAIGKLMGNVGEELEEPTKYMKEVKLDLEALFEKPLTPRQRARVEEIQSHVQYVLEAFDRSTVYLLRDSLWLTRRFDEE